MVSKGKLVGIHNAHACTNGQSVGGVLQSPDGGNGIFIAKVFGQFVMYARKNYVVVIEQQSKIKVGVVHFYFLTQSVLASGALAVLVKNKVWLYEKNAL